MAFRMVKVRLAHEGQPFSFKLNDLRNLLELDYIRVLSFSFSFFWKVITTDSRSLHSISNCSCS